MTQASPSTKSSARSAQPKESRMKTSAFDVTVLKAQAENPLWQAMHDAQVTAHHTDGAQNSLYDGVMVSIQNAATETALVALVSKQELPASIEEWPAVGTAVRVRLGDAPKDGAVARASIRQAALLDMLLDLENKAAQKQPLAAAPVAEVKGGYSVAVGIESAEEIDAATAKPWLRAFLPKSHGALQRAATLWDVSNLHVPYDLVEFSADRANAVVSRLGRLKEQRSQNMRNAWSSIHEGDIVRGTVRSVVAFGAFVEVNGVQGLLHGSDITWASEKPNVREYVQEGQEVTVKVLSVDAGQRRLRLGLKQLSDDPWAAFKALKKGDDVTGTVVSVVDFGAFIRVADGVEGMIHVSELSWQRVKHPSDKVKIGDSVRARVLEIDVTSHRLSLSMKAIEENPYTAAAAQFEVGSKYTGTIKSITDFGAFVELTAGVEGMIHISELSWGENVKHPKDVVQQGQSVEVLIIGNDLHKRRIACSLKQTTPNPADTAESIYTVGSEHTLKVVKVSDKDVVFALSSEADGFIGVCPLRELSSDVLERAAEVARMGQEMRLEVTAFDRRHRKVLLSAKAVVEKETRAAYDEYRQKEQRGSDKVTLGDVFSRHNLNNKTNTPT